MAFFQILNVAADPTEQQLGGVVLITAETWNTSGALATPGTSTSIRITAPDGSEDVAYTAMTFDSTGKASYKYASSTSKKPGHYTVEIRVVDTGDTSLSRSEWKFKLVNAH
jgi:hypothetical protein